MRKIILLISVVMISLACILVFNAVMLSSKQVASERLEGLNLSDEVFQNLSKAIQYPTISFGEEVPVDSITFIGFHKFLEATFPLTHATLSLKKINTYSLLYTWEGSEASKKPIIFMSHQDVVPVDEPTLKDWEADPFEGKISKTDIIGRGSMDDKASLIALLEAVELLLEESFKPSQTIYLAFGHDEEVGGSKGAAEIVKYLKSKDVQAVMTLDEGGFLAENMVPGIDKPIAMVNLAEKGFASFNLIVKTQGGHSSQPPKENTIGMLAQAIVNLENNQLPYKLVKPIDYQFEYRC